MDMWWKIGLLQIILLAGIDIFAQNILPDSILSDTYLSIDNSPYKTGKHLIINRGVTLEIEAGVQLLITDAISINNYGRFIVKGKKKSPVLFTTELDTEKWAYVNTSGSFIAKNLIIKNATRFLYSNGGDTIIVNDCKVINTYGTVGDDCIGVHNVSKVQIRNSTFEGNPEAGKTDALDLDGISDDTISGNIIFGFSDDGIDIGTGSKNIVISGNIIHDCDMAISVGENSTAIVSGNLLTYCVSGIQSHFGSIVSADQNTLHGNIQGLRAFHNSSEETSGGTLLISNSIISECINRLLIVKENSVVSINYCLSDSLISNGVGNITGPPGYNISRDDYRLSRNSLAIDAGDPDKDRDGINYLSDIDDQDADGTRLDLGYYPFFQSSLRIIEISPSNLSLYPDDSGDYSDWFKLFNTADSLINLKNYYFSDNPDDPEKFQLSEDLIIYGKDTLIFRADKLETPGTNHLPFKFSGEGEYLSVNNTEGMLVDEKLFPRVPMNYIYKRIGDSENWAYSQWSPGETTELYTGLCEQPLFSNPGGGSNFPVDVGIYSKTQDDSIYYSIDGVYPKESQLYKDSISIAEPLTLRSIISKVGYVNSYVSAAAYFDKNEFHLPLLSISTNEENLYGPAGIYSNPWKESSEWERPASISYYNGNKHFSAIAGIKIQGGNSVGMPKKSFRFHFRGGYGFSRLEATPFSSGPSRFKNLVVRSGYDDDISNTLGTMLRDPFSCDLWERLGEMATKSTWSVLLLNNNYWGIYNIRESINEYFVEDHMGIKNFDLVRFQKWGPDLKYGSWNEWNKLEDYFNRTDFSLPEAYDEVNSFMDINSLLNLLSFVECTQFRSWTWGAFVIKPVNGKWSWTIWDTDRSFDQLSWNGFTEYAITSAEKWPNFIPQKLILNERFKNELINRNCDLLNSLLIPEKAIYIYDSLVAILSPEMEAEYARWSPGNRSQWEANNERVRDFLRNRPSYVYSQMRSYFKLDDTVTLNLDIIGKGKIVLNSLEIDDSKWKGIYMKGIPVSLKAVPGEGSNFIRWEGLSDKHLITVYPSEGIHLTAVFDTTSGLARDDIVINEIMYNPLYPGNSEWIELYNPNDFSLTLDGFTLSDGGTGNEFEFPSGTIIDPDDYIVVAGNLSNYGAEFGLTKTVQGSFNNGISGFKLSNGGEHIYLFNSLGALEDEVQYQDNLPWPYQADGLGPSLQLSAPELDNILPQNWFVDTDSLFTPGAKNIKYSNIVEEVYNKKIKVFPNPAEEMLFIESPGKNTDAVIISLYTLSGKKLAVNKLNPGTFPGRISWEHGIKIPGMYILKIVSVHEQDMLGTMELILIQ